MKSTDLAGVRRLVWGTPKGHERRDVPIHRFLVDELAAHIAGRAADALVFTAPQGGTLRVRNFRRAALDPAAGGSASTGCTRTRCATPPLRLLSPAEPM